MGSGHFKSDDIIERRHMGVRSFGREERDRRTTMRLQGVESKADRGYRGEECVGIAAGAIGMTEAGGGFVALPLTAMPAWPRT